MTAFPSITAVTFAFGANEDPITTGFTGATPTGGTTNLLKSAGGVCLKNQPSGTGFGAQYTSSTFGPDMEAWCKVVTLTATAGQEILGIMLRIQQEGSGAVDFYYAYALLSAGTDGWTIERVINNSGTSLTTGTRDIAAGDYMGAKVEDSGGNPVISAMWCPAASDPTVPGNWTTVCTVTDSNVAKLTGTGKIAVEVQGIVTTLDDLRAGTIVTSSPDATVVAVVADATGAAPAAAVTPIQTVTAVVAAATGDSPGPVTTASAGTDTLGYANGLLGTPWLPWASATRPTITSGKAYWTSGGFNDVSYPVSIGPDCFAEAILETVLAASDQSYGLGVRLTAHSNAADGYMFEVHDAASGGPTVTLYKGAAFTSIGTASGFTSSTIDGLRLVAVGTSIQGYLRISGVWTLAVSATDATYTSGGYLGFWIIETAATLGIDQVSWGPATAGTNATVTAVPAVASGVAPVASATLTANATVTAVAAVATGDTPAAVVTGSGSATVTAVPALALGIAPPANSILSAVVSAPAVVSLGSAPAAVLSGAGNGSVTAVPALALGSAPVGVLSGAQTWVTVVAGAAGAGVAAAVSAGATVLAVPAAAVGQAPRPAVSPAPVGGGGVSGDVAATFAEASS